MNKAYYASEADITCTGNDRVVTAEIDNFKFQESLTCLLYTSPSPRDRTRSRMPSSA